MANLTIEDMAHVLIMNSIPVLWVDHAYAYRLHYLNQCHTSDDTKYLGLYNYTDDKHLVCIALHGIPPLLPDWDNWWAPSDSNITRIYTLMAIKEGEGCYCLDNSDYWLLLGGEPYPLYIWQQPWTDTLSSPTLDEDVLPFTYPDGTAIEDAPPIPMEGDPNAMDANITQHQESRDSDMLGGRTDVSPWIFQSYRGEQVTVGGLRGGNPPIVYIVIVLSLPCTISTWLLYLTPLFSVIIYHPAFPFLPM